MPDTNTKACVRRDVVCLSSLVALTALTVGGQEDVQLSKGGETELVALIGNGWSTCPREGIAAVLLQLRNCA